MDISPPVFSVIVPTYNQAHFLPAALDSLLVQTCSNWEAVIVNDGSSDDTPRVMENYAARDSRFRPVHKPNGGVASALNAGLRHARGEWICWLSSDDLFEPDKLEIHAAIAAENPAIRFMHTSFSLLHDETGLLDINALDTSVIPPQELQVLQFFRFNYINGISIAIHREVFELVGNFNESLRYGQDYDMWLRISALFPLYFINKRTSITRIHPGQGTNLFTEAGIYDSCHAGLNFLNQHNFKELFPFLDLTLPDHVLFAIQQTVSVLTETTAYLNRCGYAQAMTDRLHEWLSSSPAEIRALVQPYLTEVIRSITQSGLPTALRSAFASLEHFPASFTYQSHDFFELLQRHVQYLEEVNRNEVPALKKYLSCFAQDGEHKRSPSLSGTTGSAASQELCFPESALARKNCIDKGQKMGGSAHSPFGLETPNADFSDSTGIIYRHTLPRSVLLVVHGFPPTSVGGVEVYTQNLAREMSLQGITVTVLYPQVESTDRLYSFTSDNVEGITLVKFHVPRGNLFSSIISENTNNAFGNFIRSQNFDMVHFHHVFEHMSISMIAAAKETGVPVAITLHDFWLICPRAQLFIEETGTICSGPEGPAKCAHCLSNTGWYPKIDRADIEEVIAFRREYVRTLLPRIDLLFAPSHFVADLFSRHGFGDNKITVAPLGIEKIAISSPKPAEAGIRFGFMGTIHPVKNVMQLVEAFSATHGQARLDMYGGGELHRVEELTACISDQRITYHGSYLPEQLPEILASIDVLVVPSLIESFCLTAREALNVGIPVLAARVGGILEIIHDGVNGILFDPCNSKELANLLQRITNDNSLLKKLKTNAIPVKSIEEDTSYLLNLYSFLNRFAVSASKQEATLVEPLSAPPHSTPAGNSLKKIKIAVFSLDSKDNACGHYRIQAPIEALADGVELSWGIEYRDNTYHAVPGAAEAADIIVVQRFFPRPETAEALDYLYSLGKPLIFEIDDLLTRLPATNPNRNWGEQSVPHILEFVRKCSAITVSTEELKKHFSQYNAAVHVLPNLLEEGIWHRTVPPSSGKVVIGYAGTATHVTDLVLLEDVLGRIASQYENRVAFTFMGCATEKISRLPGFSYIPFETTFEAYAGKLQETPVDIMLVPLEDNEFNRCKSNVKWLEYSACGIAGIYADLPPYNTCITQGETGILVGNTPQQWFSAIDLLVRNPELRRSIARRARQKVMSDCTLQSGAQRWLEVYRDVAAKAGDKGDTAPTAKRSARVSIIIPAFNQLPFTRQCLDGLFATLPATTACEIIVVDNGSTDGTPEYLRNMAGRVTAVANRENLGFARACNQGARTASGDILLFLNNDTIPRPGWFEALLSPIDGNEADICGARLLYPDGRCQHAGIAFDERGLGYHIFCGFPGDAAPVVERRRMQAVTGACMAIRKSLFHELGGLDEGFINGFEDVDLCLRAGERGRRILYVPESVLVHHAERSSGRKDHEIENLQRFFSRWMDRIRQDDTLLYARFGLESRREPDGSLKVYPVVGNAPRVSIIIPLYNRVELTQACLLALERSTDRGCYELVLVDNGSSDGTINLLREWESRAVIIRNPENRGFAAACNQGARAARGKYLLFLNNDTEVTDGWLESLTAILDDDPTVAAVGAKLLFPDGTVQHAGIMIVDDRAKGDPLVGRNHLSSVPGDHPYANKLMRMQAVTAACVLMRRTAFEAVGGFDEVYWNGYEDLDLCFRFGEQEWKIVYQPASVIVHHESKSGPERYLRAKDNIRRLHERWLGKIRPDMIIMPDTRVIEGAAMLEGPTGTYEPPTNSRSPLHRAYHNLPAGKTE